MSYLMQQHKNLDAVIKLFLCSVNADKIATF